VSSEEFVSKGTRGRDCNISRAQSGEGLAKVIACGHIVDKDSTAILVLTNRCLQVSESGVVSGSKLHMTSRGPM
jgi:hypothetical protein